MECFDFKLKAKNSSGEQELTLVKSEGEYYFILTGEYGGKEFQVDFDELTRSDLEDLGAAIQLILESSSVD